MSFFRSLLQFAAKGKQNYYENFGYDIVLPADYTRLDFLQAVGAQYINTLVIPNSPNTMVEIKFQYLDDTGDVGDAVMGCRSGDLATRFYPSSRPTDMTNDRMVLGNTVLSFPIDNKVHTLIFNDGYHNCYLDGEVYGNIGSNFTPGTQPIYLFGLNLDGNIGDMSSSRIWYCKIWKEGTLLRNLVPCLNDNNEPGFYDDVSKTFFKNLGTGSFTYRHIVKTYKPSRLFVPLDYIIANGAQYIDTGIPVWETQDWAIEFKVSLSEHYDYNNILGYGDFVDTANETWAASDGWYYLRIGGIGKTHVHNPPINTPFTVTHDNTGRRLFSIVNNFITQTSNIRANASGYDSTVWFGHREGGQYLKGKIYYLKIWKDHRLVRDFIPCAYYTGVLGLYDKVSQQFFTSPDEEGFSTDQEIELPDIDIGIYPVGTVWDYEYTGAADTIELEPGLYQLEAWGASGGSGTDGKSVAALGGKGGYSTGNLTLTEFTTLHIYVGGEGARSTTSKVSGAGFNGGGNGYTGSQYSSTIYNGAGGGGASDIRLNTDSLYSRVLVAGGGGGGANGGTIANQRFGGAGGGESGQNVVLNGSYTSGYRIGTGATLIGGGTTGYFGSGSSAVGACGTGTFGIGGNTGTFDGSGGGGGGGWYGGAAGAWSPGTGGSGFVYTAESIDIWKDANISESGSWLLDSGYFLESTNTVAGNESFLDPDGTLVVGHSGNGYVRITKIG